MDNLKKAAMMRRTKWVDGQGLIEFALILPVLLLLVIGAVDLGRAFFIKVILEDSAREGAYHMLSNPIAGRANSFALTKAAVQVEAQDSGIAIPSSDIEVKCMQGGAVDNTCPSESTVVVTVRYKFQLVLNTLFKGPIQLANDARMLIPCK